MVELRSRVEAKVEYTEFLSLRQLKKDSHVRLSESPLNLSDWPGRLCLFAVSNKRGYFIAARNDEFIASPLHSLRTALTANEPCEPQYANKIGSGVVSIKFTCDDDRFVVCLRNGRVMVYNTPRNPGDLSSSTSELPLVHEFSHSGDAIRDVQPNPHDRLELIAVLRGNKGSSTPSKVELLDTRSCSIVGNLDGATDQMFQTAICWSPKGKQLVVGHRSGQLVQYGVDGAQKGIISQSEVDQPAREVASVAWLENTAFFVVYKNPEEEHEYSTFIVLNDPKTGLTTDVSIDDPSPPWGMASRESARFYAHLKSWGSIKHLLFVGDAPADDIGVIGFLESESGGNWVKFELDDTARASVPMTEDGSPSSLIGLEVDLTSTTTIITSAQFGDDIPPLPAAPILLVYTSEGLVQGYHILNTNNPVYPDMMPPSSPSEMMAEAPSTPPAKPAPPPFPVVATPVTSPVVSTTPAQTPATGFGFGGNPPVYSASSFGSANLGAFSPPAAPAFGQSSFGSTTPFGKPSFGTSSFGTQPAPSAPTAFAGFGTKPAAPAFGSSGFGSAPASTAPPTSSFGGTSFGGKGFGAFATGGASGFGTGSFGSSTSSTQGTTSTQAPPPVPAFGKPAFGAPSLGSAPPVFGASSFGSGNQSSTGLAPSPSVFGAQNTAFGSLAPKPSAIPPGTGAFGSGGSSATSPAAFTTPAPKPATMFGASSFGSAAQPTSIFGGPVTPLKPAIGTTISSTPTTTPAAPPPAFGSTTPAAPPPVFGSTTPVAPPPVFGSTTPVAPPPVFGSTTPAGTPSAPAFGSSTPLGFGAKPTDKPVFGSATAFGSGGFKAFAPKSTTPTSTPVSAPAGSGFAGFAPASQAGGFKGFGTSSSGSFADMLSKGDGVASGLKPAVVFGGPPAVTPSKPPIATFGQRHTKKVDDDDDDEEDSPLKSKFPEEELENREPTRTSQRPTGLPGDESVTTPTEPTLNVESQFSGLSIPSSAPSSSAPPSTPPARSPAPVVTPPTKGAETKIPALPVPLPDDEEQEDGEGEDDDEAGGDHGEEEDEEDEVEDEEFVISASSEGGDTDEEEEPSGGDSSYIFAQHNSLESLKSVSSNDNESQDGTVHPPRSYREGTVSPPDSPQQPTEKSRQSTSPPPGGSSTPLKTPSSGLGLGVPALFASKYGGSFLPTRSSPLSSPPINNPPSPEKPFSPPKFGKPLPKKVPVEQQDEEDETQRTPTGLKQRNLDRESEPESSGRAPGLIMPLPTTNEGKTIKRPKTPPLSSFGLGFGQGPKSKPAPTTGPPASLAQGSNLPRPVGTFTPPPNLFGGPTTQRPFPPPTFSAAPPKSNTPPPVPLLFGSQAPPVPSFSKPPQPTPPPAPKPTGLEAQFIRVIEITSNALDKLHDCVTEFAGSQQALNKSNAGLDARGAKWSAAELKSLRKVILNLEDDALQVKDTELDLKKQISELEGMILKAETQHEEIRRFIRARDDPSFAQLSLVRHLGPEHAENQHRLRKLIQIVSDRVQQLEDIVAESKKKVDRAKTGSSHMQTPTLEMISRSLNRIQSGAQMRIQDLDTLTYRIGHLDVSPGAADVSTTVAVDSHAPSRRQRPSKPSNTRPPITSRIRAEAAAALNSERSGSKLKAALLSVRQDPLSSQHVSERDVTTANGMTGIVLSSRAIRQVRNRNHHKNNGLQNSKHDNSTTDSRSANNQPLMQGKSSLGLPGVSTGLSFSRSTPVSSHKAPEIGRLPKPKGSRSYRLPSDDESEGGHEVLDYDQ